jgi:membrane protein
VLGLSAEIAYRFLFAVFPFGLFVAALGAFVATFLRITNPAEQIVRGLADNLPQSIGDALRPELERLLSSARPDLLTIGAIGALWAATGGTNAVVKGIHRAYDVEEIRPFLMRYVVAVGLTLVTAIGVVASFVTIIGGAIITQQTAARSGLGAEATTLLEIARWPVVFLALTVVVAVLYRYAPSVMVPWRWVAAGAAVFAAGWLIATAALGWYAGTVADYGTTYGSLGAVIVLMLWFYVSAAMLMLGAEVTASLARHRSPESIRRRGEEEAIAEGVARVTDGVRQGVGSTARRTIP